MIGCGGESAMMTSWKLAIPKCVRHPRRVTLVGILVVLAVTLTIFTLQVPATDIIHRLSFTSTRKKPPMDHAMFPTVNEISPSVKPVDQRRQSGSKYKRNKQQHMKRNWNKHNNMDQAKPSKGGKSMLKDVIRRHMADTTHDDDVARMFRERRAEFRRVCWEHKETHGKEVTGMVRQPFYFPQANFTLCGVPKVGITFWKRVFFFLFSKDKLPDDVSSPFEVNRFYVHTHGTGKGTRVDTGKAGVLDTLFNTRRAMFARDPWSRLWSAYVDKFIFPDSWMDYGKKIVAMRQRLNARTADSLRRQSQFEMLVSESEKSLRTFNTSNKMKCPDDITFAEFLYFAVNKNRNAHWRPVHEVCNPCIFDPIYLGKMETFSRDSSYILNAAGLGKVLDQQHQNHASHVLDELEQLTAYHYMHFKAHQRDFQNCLDDLGVARRLWRGFQLNGYIPADNKFPEKVLSRQLSQASYSQDHDYVVSQAREAYSAAALSHSEWSARKRKILVGAFQSVPRELLARVQEEFRLDFLLFQYDSHPADIFSE